MTDLAQFSPAPAMTPPAADEIHLWRVPLDPPAEKVAACRDLLSQDERQRADRFHFDRHRRRFTVGRGVLRRLLGQYLDRAPRDIRFSYGPKDKPAAEDSGTLSFNLSNSHELALIAVLQGPEVGVDLERLRPMPDAEDLAERFFSRSERVALRAVAAGSSKDRAFFRCWTRKEAYVKATGDGLSLPLDRFDVSLDEPRFLALDGDPEIARGWSLFHLEPGEGYLGALAVPGRRWRLRGWQWAG
ncbi:MAG: 4'-phosphopantetheinyl transferase superfamily protein [Acidobacteriota bacterium]